MHADTNRIYIRTLVLLFWAYGQCFGWFGRKFEEINQLWEYPTRWSWRWWWYIWLKIWNSRHWEKWKNDCHRLYGIPPQKNQYQPSSRNWICNSDFWSFNNYYKYKANLKNLYSQYRNCDRCINKFLKKKIGDKQTKKEESHGVWLLGYRCD